MLRLLPNIEGFGGIPGSEAYQNKKMNTPNVDACAVYIHFQKGEVFTTWAPLPNPTIKASLSKVQALKFILQIAASKQENCVFPNSNLQILSSKSKSPLFFCQLVQLQVFKNLLKKSKIIYMNFGSFWKNEFGALILSVFLFFPKKREKRSVLPRKMG